MLEELVAILSRTNAGIYTHRGALTRGVTKRQPKKASFLRREKISCDRRRRSKVFRERPSGKFNSAMLNISSRYTLSNRLVRYYQFDPAARS